MRWSLNRYCNHAVFPFFITIKRSKGYIIFKPCFLFTRLTSKHAKNWISLWFPWWCWCCINDMNDDQEFYKQAARITTTKQCNFWYWEKARIVCVSNAKNMQFVSRYECFRCSTQCAFKMVNSSMRCRGVWLKVTLTKHHPPTQAQQQSDLTTKEIWGNRGKSQH